MVVAVGDLFEGYLASLESSSPIGRSYDEVFDTRGGSYEHYADVVSVVSEMSSEDVGLRASRLARAFMDQGVTFDLDGEERPFPLDVVPRIFTCARMASHIRGRGAKGEGTRVVLGRHLQLRAHPPRRPDPAATDHELARIPACGQGGQPTERSEDPRRGHRHRKRRRRLVRRARGQSEESLGSELRARQQGRNGKDPARDLLGPDVCSSWPTTRPASSSHCRRAAPAGVSDPNVVVLTPGVFNSAFYEHALLARLMGVHLVEGRDLTCHGVDVFLQTTDGEMPVHVIYRRVDDEYPGPSTFPAGLTRRLSRPRQRRTCRSGDGGERHRQRHR